MNFENIKKALLDALAENGIDKYEIYYMSSKETNVETLNNEINAFSDGTSGGICRLNNYISYLNKIHNHLPPTVILETRIRG